jgi:signal transduction histidine kinase/ActR/RegA family two-component response regulator
MRLRSHLLVLVAAALAPMVAVTAVLGVLFVDQVQDTFRSGAFARNRAFMSAIEADVHGDVKTLQAMATSRALRAGDLVAFKREMHDVLASQSAWRVVALSDASGALMAAAASVDSGPLADPDPRSLAKALTSDVPLLGTVLRLSADGAFGVAVRLPLVRDGRREGLLTAVVDTSQFQRLIVAQQMPAGWVSGIVDADGHFVGRVPLLSADAMAAPNFRAAVARAPEGWYRGRTIEGTDSYTAHLTMPGTGWSLGLAMPASEVLSAARRVAWATALGVAATLALALAVAFALSRRIAAPVALMLARARHRDTPVPMAPPSIPELAELAHALEQGQSAVHERELLLERERGALREADRAKDEFLAMLGHELRNPLAAIASSAYLLRALPPDTPSRGDALAILERQARQMTRLIDDLLDVSRLTMGKVLLDPQTFELDVLTRAVVQTWEHSGRIAPGRVAIAAEPTPVHADRGRIEQVIANLLDNAAKFSPPQTRIDVRIRPDADEAVLEVEDGGAGIPPEFIGRVFERFVQGPQGLNRGTGGLGLGLAVVSRIVELHGGNASAANRPPRGACLTVRLPLARSSVDSADGAPLMRDDRLLRILIVEDNDDVRETLRVALGAHGHRVRAVANGADALAAAAADPPDVVLLDLGLPDMSGHEVARHLRHDMHGAGLHIVALTGYGQPSDERRARDAGCDLHVRKPIDPSELLSLLEQLGRGNNGRTADAA